MKAILSEVGFAFNATEYIEAYGNEAFLKLCRKYTIRTVDRTTKIPQVTKMFQLIKCGDMKIIELPRFVMNDLVSKHSTLSKSSPIEEVDNQLPKHKQIESINYIGKSNANQKIVVRHIVKRVFGEGVVGGLTLKQMAGCHAADTDILMYDGSVKRVQDIQVGELLMGDDSTPRNVLSVARGSETMYRITSKKGESYVVNEGHILCLTYTNKHYIRYNPQYKSHSVRWFDNKTIKRKTTTFKSQKEAKEFYNSLSNDYVVELSVLDYLNLSDIMKKDLKGYKTAVEFPKVNVPIDPYMIGYWLGDGNANTSIITSQDACVLKYFASSLPAYECYLQYQLTNNYQYRINGDGNGRVGCNKFLKTLQDLDLVHNKHIPSMYKCNSRENRLKLLAGLLDSDGCLTRDNCTFEFSQSGDHEQLFDDVLYLARSLGFACRKSKQKSTWTYNGIKKSGFKLRMHISGEGTDQIPTLCPRKQAAPRRQIKNVLVSQIKVEKLEKANYYGFHLDGNQRYVMGSFTVTHNTGKTFTAMDVIGKMKLKTLIVVPNTYLLDQWVNLLQQYFPTAKIGTLYGKQKSDGDIIVGIINTVSDLRSFEVMTKKPLPNIGKTIKYTKLMNMVNVDDILKTVGLTIFDESHMYVSKEFRKVFKRIWSRYTLGLSATPDIREDKLDGIHQAWLGPIVVADELDGYSLTQDSFVSDANMVEYHARNEHCQFNVRDDGMLDYTSIVQAIITDPYRNDLIIDHILELMNNGLYTFVFSDRRSHLEHLYYLLERRCSELDDVNVNIELPESNKKVILYGGADANTIDNAKKVSTVVFTTYAYSAVGVSITKMNGLILATPRRSNMKQIINRVFRLGSDQSVKRMIVDIVDAKFPIKQQVRERIKAYQERGCTIVKTKKHASEMELS